MDIIIIIIEVRDRNPEQTLFAQDAKLRITYMQIVLLRKDSIQRSRYRQDKMATIIQITITTVETIVQITKIDTMANRQLRTWS